MASAELFCTGDRYKVWDLMLSDDDDTLTFAHGLQGTGFGQIVPGEMALVPLVDAFYAARPTVSLTGSMVTVLKQSGVGTGNDDVPIARLTVYAAPTATL